MVEGYLIIVLMAAVWIIGLLLLLRSNRNE